MDNNTYTYQKFSTEHLGCQYPLATWCTHDLSLQTSNAVERLEPRKARRCETTIQYPDSACLSVSFVPFVLFASFFVFRWFTNSLASSLPYPATVLRTAWQTLPCVSVPGTRMWRSLTRFTVQDPSQQVIIRELWRTL